MRPLTAIRTQPPEWDSDQRPAETVPRPLLPRVRMSPKRVRDLHRRLSDLHHLLREERDQDRLARLRSEYAATAAVLINLYPPPVGPAWVATRR